MRHFKCLQQFFGFVYFLLFTTVLSQWGFSRGKFRLLSLGKASSDTRATQPTVHAGCFSVSIIHQTLTWAMGSLMCAQMLMRVIAQGSVRTHIRESALKVDSWRKISCRTRELNLRQRCDGRCSTNELHPHTKLKEAKSLHKCKLKRIEEWVLTLP